MRLKETQDKMVFYQNMTKIMGKNDLKKNSSSSDPENDNFTENFTESTSNHATKLDEDDGKKDFINNVSNFDFNNSINEPSF